MIRLFASVFIGITVPVRQSRIRRIVTVRLCRFEKRSAQQRKKEIMENQRAHKNKFKSH